MTQRVGNVVILAPEESKKCEVCGETAECRPYGPNGCQICFKCANSSDEMRTEVMRRMHAFLNGKEAGGSEQEGN
jgi:hypothetical protein